MPVFVEQHHVRFVPLEFVEQPELHEFVHPEIEVLGRKMVFARQGKVFVHRQLFVHPDSQAIRIVGVSGESDDVIDLLRPFLLGHRLAQEPADGGVRIAALFRRIQNPARIIRGIERLRAVVR